MYARIHKLVVNYYIYARMFMYGSGYDVKTAAPPHIRTYVRTYNIIIQHAMRTQCIMTQISSNDRVSHLISGGIRGEFEGRSLQQHQQLPQFIISEVLQRNQQL